MGMYWARRQVFGGALLLTLLATGDRDAAALGNAYDWLQFNGGPSHTGNNTSETTLSTANVSSLVQRFQVSLPASIDGAPVELSNVATAGGTRNLLFLTTMAGHIIALDANTGLTVWSHQYGPGTCLVNNGSQPCYTSSSPAIDPLRTYVYSFGLDGMAHKYAVADGSEVTTGGWPELVTNKPYNEKSASALATATATGGSSYLYVVNGGYPGDQGDYQGHVTTINLSNGAQNVFNTQCSNQTVHFVETPGTPDCAGVQSAVWARSGVVYDPEVNEVFFGTGNGNFVPSSLEWGDSILAIHPDGTGVGTGPIDSYTPATFSSLQASDSDLGSTAPALLPTPASSAVAHLALQSGKDGLIRLLNLDNLSGAGAPGHTGGEVGTVISVPQGNGVLTAPAVWVRPSDSSTWAFVANGSGVSALELVFDANGNPSLTKVWQSSNAGTSPLIANGVLYVAVSGSLRALDPATGTQLWQNTQIGSIHWASPVVANGMLYIGNQSAQFTAFGLATEPALSAPALPGLALWVALVTLVCLGARKSRLLTARGAESDAPTETLV
jgi:outer membrane protein assembly factor BamB